MLAAALLLLQTAPAAQTTACKATDASLPLSLLGWVKPGDEFAPGKAAMIGFRIGAAGTYGVALDQAGWIDLVPGTEGGTALPSVKHGHGPECSTIRKIVRFDLKPGLYRLYVSGLSTPRVKAMLVAGD